MTIEQLYEIYRKHNIVCTDTRQIIQGSIFFALKGDNFNGNKFAADALKKGAAFAVIDEDVAGHDERFIKTDNVLLTLQKLAAWHVDQLKIPVLAITGSNGKTTTKELITRVISKKFKTHATKGNLNNHIGVPLTVLSTPFDTDFLVVEMGANHQKEIEMLCNIAHPRFGLINNVGKAHLEGFGGFEGVKKGKGEMYDYIKQTGGVVFINDDNDHLKKMAAERGIDNMVQYGSSEKCFLYGRLLSSIPTLKADLMFDSKKMLETRLIGDYNFENILAAACIGKYFGVDANDICNAIELYEPDNSRSQVIHSGSNTIVLDAYNANPTSMKAAILNFQNMPAMHKYIFIGEMAELGDDTSDEHAALLDLLNKTDAEKIILVGKNFEAFQTDDRFLKFNNSEEAAVWMQRANITQSTILIKGSRSSKMELVLNEC